MTTEDETGSLEALRRDVGIGIADCLAGKLSSRSVREIAEGVLAAAKGAAELDRGDSDVGHRERRHADVVEGERGLVVRQT